MSQALEHGVLAPQEDVKHYGTLPWRVNGEGYLEVLLLCSGAGGQWTVVTAPETGTRTPLQTAEQTAFGEAGVFGRLGPEPIGNYRCPGVRDSGVPEMRAVTVYGLHVRGALAGWQQENRGQRRWLPIAEACGLADEPGLAELLSSLLASRSPAGRCNRDVWAGEPAGQSLLPRSSFSPMQQVAARNVAHA